LLVSPNPLRIGEDHPKSIDRQYQHDVSQPLLKKDLTSRRLFAETRRVNLNTLLIICWRTFRHRPALAKNIVVTETKKAFQVSSAALEVPVTRNRSSIADFCNPAHHPLTIPACIPSAIPFERSQRIDKT